jgi:hypothetical protein
MQDTVEKSGMDMESIEKLIGTMALTCQDRLPKQSILDVDDLKQEGWIVYLSCCHKYDDAIGAKFSTYLWGCLSNRYQNIIRTERRYEKRVLVSEDVASLAVSGMQSQERKMIVFDAIIAVHNHCPELAYMIMYGPSDELVAIARDRRRRNRAKRGLDAISGKLVFSKWLLETYYGIKIGINSTVWASVYNIL